MNLKRAQRGANERNILYTYRSPVPSCTVALHSLPVARHLFNFITWHMRTCVDGGDEPTAAYSYSLVSVRASHWLACAAALLACSLSVLVAMHRLWAACRQLWPLLHALLTHCSTAVLMQLVRNTSKQILMERTGEQRAHECITPPCKHQRESSMPCQCSR